MPSARPFKKDMRDLLRFVALFALAFCFLLRFRRQARLGRRASCPSGRLRLGEAWASRK